MLKVTVGCLITYKDSLVMVLEEQDGRISWDIPAGGMDEGESPDQTIRREILEETGLRVDSSDDLRFRAIFYDQSADTTTVHFLYEWHLNEKPALKAQDSSIQKVALRSKEQIRQMIANQEYEHDLARKRFENYLTDTDDTFVVSKL